MLAAIWGMLLVVQLWRAAQRQKGWYLVFPLTSILFGLASACVERYLKVASVGWLTLDGAGFRGAQFDLSDGSSTNLFYFANVYANQNLLVTFGIIAALSALAWRGALHAAERLPHLSGNQA